MSVVSACRPYLAAILLASSACRDGGNLPRTPPAIWRLSAESFREIGSESDTMAMLFDVADVTKFSNGDVAIIQGPEIRVFGSDGEHLRTIGRRGEGPGEFWALQGIFVLRGDTLVAYDHTGGQIRSSLFLEAGTFLTRTAAVLGGWAEPLAVTRTGNVILKGYSKFDSRVPLDANGYRPVTYRSYVRLLFFERGGGVKAMADFPGTAGQPMFGPSTVIGAGDSTIYVATNDSPDVVALSVPASSAGLRSSEDSALIEPPGTRVAFKIPFDPEPVGQADIDTAKARLRAQAERMPPDRREEKEAMLSPKFANKMPWIDAMLVDAEGNVWIRRYLPRHRSRVPRRFEIIGPNGRHLASVEMPARFTPMKIGADYVLGVSTNSDDVESVRAYGIIKN